MHDTKPEPDPHPTAARRQRRDATRSIARIRTTAREVFAEHGTDAPLDAIARRAGVGNATLYRHFPTRRDLLIAVYADEVDDLRRLGQRLLSEPAAIDALFVWLAAFLDHARGKRDLALAIPDDRQGQRSALFDDWHRSMRVTAAALLDRAVADGTIRPDTDLADLLALVSSVALAAADDDQRRRLLRTIRGGISVAGATSPASMTTPGSLPDDRS